jgi:hypothetical protein
MVRIPVTERELNEFNGASFIDGVRFEARRIGPKIARGMPRIPQQNAEWQATIDFHAITGMSRDDGAELQSDLEPIPELAEQSEAIKDYWVVGAARDFARVTSHPEVTAPNYDELESLQREATLLTLAAETVEIVDTLRGKYGNLDSFRQRPLAVRLSPEDVRNAISNIDPTDSFTGSVMLIMLWQITTPERYERWVRGNTAVEAPFRTTKKG